MALFIVHDSFSGEQRGIAALRGLLAFFRQAFGEQRTDLQLTLAEGDYVAILHTHPARSSGRPGRTAASAQRCAHAR